MRKIDRLLAEYGESHQNKTNKTIHWICVPAIFWSIVALLWSIPAAGLQHTLQIYSPFFNYATLVLLGICTYYLGMSGALALGMLIFGGMCLLVCFLLQQVLPVPLWQFAIAVFILAWIGQFYGHKIEGKKPSFFKDLQFLLVGPAWLLHFIYQKLEIDY